MTKNERITWIVVITVVVLLIAWATWASVMARRVRLACEAAGYDSSESVFFSREGYCSKVIVKQKIITVPLSQAIREEE